MLSSSRWKSAPRGALSVNACDLDSARQPTGRHGAALRHRTLDLHRDLIFANVQGDRPVRGPGRKTRLFQILHQSSHARLSCRWWITSYAGANKLSRGRPQDVVVTGIENTRSCASIRFFSELCRADEGGIPTLFPPQIRRFPAGNPQPFAQALRGESAENTHLFHTFCTAFSCMVRVDFSCHFSAGFSQGIRSFWRTRPERKRAKLRR